MNYLHGHSAGPHVPLSAFVSHCASPDLNLPRGRGHYAYIGLMEQRGEILVGKLSDGVVFDVLLCMHVCMCVSMDVCMYACMYVCA